MQDPERVLGVHRDRPGGRAEPIAFVAERAPGAGDRHDRGGRSDSAVDLAQQVKAIVPSAYVGGQLEGWQCWDAPSSRFLL